MTDRLQQLCRRFRASLRRLLLVLGTSRFVSIGLLVALALVLADFYWKFGHVERFVALGVLLGVLAFVVLRDIVQPLRQRWSDKEILRYFDSILPGSDDRLINLDELRQPDRIAEADSPQGRALVHEAVAQLERSLEQIDTSAVWQRRAVRRWLSAAAVVLLGCLGLAAVAEFATADRYTSIGLGRLLMPWASIHWPTRTRFVLLTPTADARVPEGEDLSVRVQVLGKAPPEITLFYNPTDESGRFTSRRIAVSMFRNTDGTAEFTFAQLSDSIRFHVAGGDGQTPPVEIHVVKPPYLREVQAFYKYPSYTGVPPKITTDPQLAGLEGTEVRLNFTASKPLREAWVQMDGQARQPLPLATEGTRFEWFHMLRDNVSYSIGLVDEHGNREKLAETYRIQVTPDRPPTARLLEPAGDLEVTRRARFPVQFQVDDDYGLKQVQVLVSKDGGAPVPLDEKITGPIPQIGKTSAGQFDWDLERMDLSGVSQLTFHLTARDVNPTGRGTAESAHLQLSLKSELDVQSNVLLAAKALLTEALLGSSHQRWAYLDAVKWLNTNEMSESDQALIRQFQDEQQSAGRAAAALEKRFQALSVEMSRNRMEGAFFARRLEQIGQSIREMAAVRQPQIAEALQQARPAAADEDTPAGRTAKLRGALTALEPSLKLAALEYQRLYFLLADWNDLQQVLVTSRRLHHLQQQVHATGVGVAPQWIGKEIEDLSEADARLLSTIAQQQETIRDSERALEEELQTLALAAQSQGRKQVFTPLKENLELLRLQAVNEKLIQIAEGIKDNRIDATLQDQLYVLKVFTFIAGKFEQAGQDVTPLAPLDANTPLVDDREIELVDVTPAAAGEPVEGLDFNPQARVDVEDIGAYQLDTIQQALVFLQSILDDQVILYTEYTDQRFRERQQSARYRRLRLEMLGIRVERAREAAEKVLEFAQDHPFAPARPHFQSLHADLETIGKLVEAGEIGRPTQLGERELSIAAQTTRRFLAQYDRMAIQLEDRARSNGTDEFGQPFAVTRPHLAALMQLRSDLGWAAALQQDVNQKTRRLLDAQSISSPGHPLLQAYAAQALVQARQRQGQVVDLVAAAHAAVAETSENSDFQSRASRELAMLPPSEFVKSLAGLNEAKLLPDLPAQQAVLLESLQHVVANLEALADERIRPSESLAQKVIETQQAISQVDLKKSPAEVAEEIAQAREKALHDFQFDMLTERVQQAPLSPAVREYMLQTLATNPDPKYRMLFSAYLSPLIPAPAQEKVDP